MGQFLPYLIAIFIIGAIIWQLGIKFWTNVKGDEIAITERRFFGKKLEPGRVFATENQVGIQAKYLTPGLHFIAWPIINVLGKLIFTTIDANELGIIEATDGQPLPAGRIFADDPAGNFHDNFQNPVAFLTNNGIRGKQLRFLTNGTFKINPKLFKITKIRKTFVPEGSIGVITAGDGASLPTGQLLGKSILNHDNFQNAELFLKEGGQKGPQTDILKPGTYNINTEIFKVEVKTATAIPQSKIGLVEALDGKAMDTKDVVVPTPEGHNNFQDGQQFINKNGIRGPQEQILTPGTYYINPYLFKVTISDQTLISQGEVAVLVSNIGKDPNAEPDLPESHNGGDAPQETGVARHVVAKGFRGIQRDVLGPGAYNINLQAYTVVKVPTVTRSVDWSKDEQTDGVTPFNPFMVVSHDGFEMTVEVRCQYRIKPEDAPYVIQRIGSVDQLEQNVIHPQIDGVFRAQVSKSPAISFQQNRAEEQKKAEEEVRKDLDAYRIEVISIMITNIHLPEELMKTTQQKNLAEQQSTMYDAQEKAEVRRKELQIAKATADQQAAIIVAQTGITIAEHEASQSIKRANGEAESTRIKGKGEADKNFSVGEADGKVIALQGAARAKAYEDQAKALGASGVTFVEVMKAISEAKLKITPDVVVSGSGEDGGSGGLVSVLLANAIRENGVFPKKG